MGIYNEVQENIAGKLENGASIEKWKDWKWQLRHSVKSISQFENLTGVKFDPYDRKILDETVAKFPLSITPYYLSLIDTDNYQNDPVFKQSFADTRELIVHPWEMK
ncbi:MAG TPA: lysine 2,3-aminomutase, partial [Bacteroidales bacterium]|nr:lysine 2,3-aminomutase [Bacteroidales bacterium]